jgi:hypothetical protein
MQQSARQNSLYYKQLGIKYYNEQSKHKGFSRPVATVGFYHFKGVAGQL